MAEETRIVKFDTALNIEAYYFHGVMQKFPKHFHEYYVIGLIEKGKRNVNCQNKTYIVESGDLVLFNPRDAHACEQLDTEPLEYRCINISREVMKKAVYEITGKEDLPYFNKSVAFQSELVPQLRELHLYLMQEEPGFKKEELFFLLLEQLVRECTEKKEFSKETQSPEVQAVCSFLEKNYMKNIALDELSHLTGLSKYHLIRIFTKENGITPYGYLETIRIDKAKDLLEMGVLPVEAALLTGFSDQSHFSHFFKKFIGLTPKQY